MNDVWLVVLNWHGRADTLDLLTGLVDEPATVLVVDNGSYDGTLEAVRAAYPHVRTVQTGRNLGFAGGNDVGIEHALAHGADVVGVLNNDTLVTPGFLSPLLEALAAGGERAVSPDIRYAAEPDVSWFRGGVLDRRAGLPVHLPPDGQPRADVGPVPTDYLTGCCLLASAATWRRVGDFDRRLFLIFEDADWSMRALAAGVELLVVPASRIAHKVSRSFTGRSALLGSYFFARNGLVFAWRHLGVLGAARFLWWQVVRPSAGELRRRHGGDVTMRVLGVAAAIGGARGPAGRPARWAAQRAQRSAGSSSAAG